MLPGDKKIPANKPSSFTKREKLEAWETGELPFKRRTTSVDIPTGTKTMTIGNVMEYRNIALDLEPGRTPKDGNTAPQDWYVQYTQGGDMAKALERATGIASKKPASERLQRQEGAEISPIASYNLLNL